MTFAHPPDRPCDATCDHPRSGDATEALARALQEALGKDEWYALLPSDAAVAANRLRRRLRAKGYEVQPIVEAYEQAEQLYDNAAYGPPIHSVTAEAADREAAGQDAETPSASAAADSPCCDCLCGNCGAAYAAAAEPAACYEDICPWPHYHSAAADLDVEVLAAALRNVGHRLWGTEGREPQDAERLAAAYAAAKREAGT